MRETTTDLYEATMALSYLREGMTRPATFDLFVRELPEERGFLVAAGLADVLDYLRHYRVGPEDVRDFAAVLHRPEEELKPLLGTTFSGEVRAVPEGSLVFAGEPLLEVTAPLPVAQLVESYVLNQISHQTALASKAARSVIAARGRPVVDFSLRRTHGPEAGLHAARAGFLTGFAGTSNVAAAASLGIPAVGTMAHSYIEAIGPEEDAFRAFARAHPGPVTLLVDTYDSRQGVRTAARVLDSLGIARGSAIRLDSGDLHEEAVMARRILDQEGLPDVRIVVSGGLDEYAVDRLAREDTPADVYAVGTRIGVSADAPYLDSAYKLVEYDDRPVMKLSAKKVSAPGRKQVYRRDPWDDLIALADEAAPEGSRALLHTVMREGEPVRPVPSFGEARERCLRECAALPASARRITAPVAPHPSTSPSLSTLSATVRQHIRSTYLHTLERGFG
jgi:nicotinate phosphoribosyltransferase